MKRGANGARVFHLRRRGQRGEGREDGCRDPCAHIPSWLVLLLTPAGIRFVVGITRDMKHRVKNSCASVLSTMGLAQSRSSVNH